MRRRSFWPTSARAGGQVERLSCKMVAQAAAEGNQVAQDIFHHAVQTLGWAVAQAVTLLAPNVVVIGGGVSLAGEPLLFSPLRREVDRYVFPPLRQTFRIVPAALGEEVVIHGGAGGSSRRMAGGQPCSLWQTNILEVSIVKRLACFVLSTTCIISAAIPTVTAAEPAAESRRSQPMGRQSGNSGCRRAECRSESYWSARAGAMGKNGQTGPAAPGPKLGVGTMLSWHDGDILDQFKDPAFVASITNCLATSAVHAITLN